MTLHVHIAGAPCMGKSVTAAQVFAKLRIMGVNAELVQEYAKEKFWEGKLSPTTQFLTAAEQTRREAFLEGRVDVIVSDSPPLLGALYASASFRRQLETCIARTQEDWLRKTYVLFVDLNIAPFEFTGRIGDARQSLELHLELVKMLRRQKISHKRFDLSPARECKVPMSKRRKSKRGTLIVPPSERGRQITWDQAVNRIVDDALETLGRAPLAARSVPRAA